MNRLRRLLQSALARNTVFMLMGHGARIGLYGAYFVLAARWLGRDGLGAFAGALAFVKIMQPFAALGSDQVLARRMSRSEAEYREAMGDALIVTLTTGVLFTILVVALNGLLFGGKVSWMATGLIACAELVFYRLQMLVRRVFQAVERLAVTAVVKAIPGPSLLAAICLFRLSSSDRTVDTWAVWYLAAMALPSVAAVVYTVAVLGRPSFAPRTAFRVLGEGFFFSLSESARVAFTDSDKIVLVRLVSEGVAGVYKAAYRLLSVVMVPVLALLDAAYARFFKSGAAGVRGSYDLAVRLLPLSVAYGALVGLGFYLAAPLAPILLGPGYEETALVLRWIAAIPVIQGASYMLVQTLTGGGHQRARSLLETFVAIVNVGLNLLLVPLYSWRASAAVAVFSEGLVLAGSFILARWLAKENPRAVLSGAEGA